MVEVHISNGDWAECEPDAAIMTARRLLDDAGDHVGYGARSLTASFYVDGQRVRGPYKRAEL